MTLGTFSVAEGAELAVVTRGDFVESRHAGSAIVLAPDGTPLKQYGRPEALILPRSAAKFFSAVAVMSSGVSLEGEDAAIAAGSHAGTARHRELVAGMLRKSGLTPDDLQCPPAWPLDEDARTQLIRDRDTQSALAMTCSGKHASMLLACAQNDWDPANYLDARHPMQERIREITERLTGEKVADTVIDGCGAPIFALSLHALARGTQHIAKASPSSPFQLFRCAASLRDAILAHPWALDGEGRINTLIIEKLGILAKWGAEGVMVMASADGTTVALKILDGSQRASTIVALTLLVRVGALDAAAVARLLPHLHLAIWGGTHQVGLISPTV